MSLPFSIHRELATSILEFLYDLLGEWDWKEKEIRLGYAQEYRELEETIRQLRMELDKNKKGKK